jgi:hypothetical protein
MDSEFPDEDVMTVDEDNHGRWKLYFDGAANAVRSGIGAVLVSPKGQQTPIAVKLGFDCTNNMTEYEACIVGVDTGGKSLLLYSKVFIFDFPRYRPPFGECCVCSSISFPFRDTSCVCVGTCVRVCM